MRSTSLIQSSLDSAIAAALVLALVAAPGNISFAQTPKTTQPAASAELPVTRVALYKNGVGFFEHAGRVTGDGRVTVDFTTSQLNDVLQSLTAIDLDGGRIAGADYNSTTPLEQQLRALPLGLGSAPNEMQFYNSIRGARVEIKGSGTFATGRLMNVEQTSQPALKGEGAITRRMATVVADSGDVRTVELTPSTTVRLLDRELNTDVTRYLELLAGNRNQSLRHLTLEDRGSGSRQLQVSYISEVPVWKSTYRILFDEPSSAATATKQTAVLQGWSVVDNTTGVDWVNVQMSLIAGAPQSFVQPLSVPYYSRRPVIGLPVEAQLAPQTHESGEPRLNTTNAALVGGSPRDPTAFQYLMPGVQEGNSIANGSGTGLGPGSGGNYGGGARRIGTAVAGAPLAQGVYGGTGQANLNENYIKSMPVSNIQSQGDNSPIARAVTAAYALASFGTSASTSQFDDYFEYRIGNPVTIRKNESAMVPILQTKIDAERVTLVALSAAPLRALWITNTSNLTLDRGSFSVVESGRFGGEGLMDPIHAGERRLLSYAVDQAIRVSTEAPASSTKVTRATASKGVVELHSSEFSERTYVIRNAASEPRTVIIEHPVRSGWSLDNKNVTKPEEITPTVYRFKISAAAGETVRLKLREQRPGATRYQLTNSDDSQLQYIVSQTDGSDAVKKALQPVFDARQKVAEKQSALDQANAALTDLHSDEERERANVTALQHADRSASERFVKQLNATEDKIASAQKAAASAEAELDSAKGDLAAKIGSFTMDETL